VSVLPGAVKTQRGHKTLEELAIEAYTHGLKYVLVVCELQGNPSRISIYEVRAELFPELVKIADLVLKGVKLSRENPLATRAYGVESLNVEYSKCISSDCFLLADILVKIFQSRIRVDPDVTILLEEDKYIIVKFQNIHGKPVGPLLRVIRVERSSESEAETSLQSKNAQ
jgi:U3 small nucleolar ribonucleoprotein protein IMP4